MYPAKNKEITLEILKFIFYIWPMNILRILLLPVSLIYGIITWLRNKLFDWGILPSRSYKHALIGVGNLSTGGTGKTPHIEYLIRLLKPQRNLATLSRGYKRKTRGFQIAGPASKASDIGDEPLQLYTRYPEITVAVCENRRTGIQKILDQKPENEAILLDDVFQHRYVKPGLNILLTDYHKIFTRNYPIPSGNLREFRSGVRRADALVITKTPCVFSPLDRKLILEEISKYGIKKVFFSFIKYGHWIPITPAAKEEKAKKAKTIFLVSGIANPTPLAEHLKRTCTELKIFSFADHYQFTASDLEKIKEKFFTTYSGSKVIITTEKDSMRLREPALQEVIKNIPVYYLPIEVEMHREDKTAFDSMVLDFVKRFPKKKDKARKSKTGKKSNPKT